MYIGLFNNSFSNFQHYYLIYDTKEVVLIIFFKLVISLTIIVKALTTIVTNLIIVFIRLTFIVYTLSNIVITLKIIIYKILNNYTLGWFQTDAGSLANHLSKLRWFSLKLLWICFHFIVHFLYSRWFMQLSIFLMTIFN